MKPMRRILLLLLAASFASAWGCNTHQWICEEAGVGFLDCCAADGKVAPVFHLCENNAQDCAARVKAAELFNATPAYAAHLYADLLAPSHRYSFDESSYYDCYTAFESDVDDRIGSLNWTLWRSCDTRDGEPAYVEASDAYMAQVVAYVKLKMAGVMPPVVVSPHASPSPTVAPTIILAPSPTTAPTTPPTPASATQQPKNGPDYGAAFFLVGLFVICALILRFALKRRGRKKPKKRNI